MVRVFYALLCIVFNTRYVLVSIFIQCIWKWKYNMYYDFTSKAIAQFPNYFRPQLTLAPMVTTTTSCRCTRSLSPMAQHSRRASLPNRSAAPTSMPSCATSWASIPPQTTAAWRTCGHCWPPGPLVRWKGRAPMMSLQLAVRDILEEGAFPSLQSLVSAVGVI